MSESFGARARKFMGWYSPEEPIDEFEEFDEVEEVAPVADITPVSRPTLTSIRREEPVEDLTRIVTIHPTAYSDAVTIGEAFRDGTPVIINLTDMGEDLRDRPRLVWVGTECPHQPVHDGAVCARHSGLGSVFRARMASQRNFACRCECAVRVDRPSDPLDWPLYSTPAHRRRDGD